MKVCKECLVEKKDEEFGKQFRNKKKTKFNLRTYCLICDRKRNKVYREKNKEILIEKRRNRVIHERERVGVTVKNGFVNIDKEEAKKRESCRHKAIELRKKGSIKDPGFCQFCAITGMKLEMHHANYEMPQSVIFLCRPCHLKMHWNVLNER